MLVKLSLPVRQRISYATTTIVISSSLQSFVGVRHTGCALLAVGGLSVIVAGEMNFLG